MTKSRGIEIFDDFLSLIFPHYCLACSQGLVKGETVVCSRCMLHLPRIQDFADPENALQNRLSPRIPVKHAMAYLRFTKRGRVQHLLHALKYNNHPEVGILFGRLFATKMVECKVAAFDLIVPVPLHASKKRKRGYNQSAKFAEGLSEILNVPFADDVMVRQLKTDTQTRKSKLGRWQNINHAFHVAKPAAIEGKKILLVDDVVTTGSTLESCGEVLLGHGCSELSIACIAQA